MRREFLSALLLSTGTITTSAQQPFRLDTFTTTFTNFSPERGPQAHIMDNTSAPHHDAGDAYDEATIVRLISKLYTTLAQLGGVDAAAIAWPPPGGHQLDLSQLTDEPPLDQRLISLLQNLPMIKTETRIAPNMLALDYLQPSNLVINRYIDRGYISAGTGEMVEPGPAPSTALLLCEGQDDMYPRLVFDVAESEYRLL